MKRRGQFKHTGSIKNEASGNTRLWRDYQLEIQYHMPLYLTYIETHWHCMRGYEGTNDIGISSANTGARAIGKPATVIAATCGAKGC